MPDTVDVDTLTTAATEAASQGDAVAAAALLRLVLDLQVTSLGADHRDLAPTLNNLAMMLERQGDAAEAERCYRRAFEVARRGAPPDDPLVQVSHANLVAFLQASGIADPLVEVPAAEAAGLSAGRSPAPASPAAPTPNQTAVTAAAPPPRREPPRQRTPAPGPTPTARSASTTTPSAATAAPRHGWLLWLLVAAGALAGAVAGWIILSPQRSDTAQRTAPVTQASPAAPPESAPETPGRPDGAPAGAASPTEVKPTDTPPAAGPGVPPGATPSATSRSGADISAPDADARRGGGTALSAEGLLCAALARSGGAWRCDPAGDPTSADAVYYYTRVRSPGDVVVGHRWTYQGQVVRTVNLQVRANPGEGFRTFSRQSLSGRRDGSWEVALIAPDGAVIDSQRFTVR
jgi:hypothetical protein